MPKRLYARSLLIVVTPMILLQTVVTAVVLERYWQRVTEQLSEATTRDVAAVIDMVESFPPEDDAQVIRIARRRLGLDVELLPGATLPQPGAAPLFSILDPILSAEIDKRIGLPHWLDTAGEDSTIEIRVQLDDQVLRVQADRSRAYASRTHQFLVWMVGTAAVLLLIAIPFLRNQIRPITQLAEAAESFGKGRPIPANFRPRGAEEVRRAGLAFLLMRERIERQIEQRTAMLTGVSHDLRTILTRFRLQLALGPKFLDLDALNKDIDDMQSMLQGYIDFARGENAEDEGAFDLEEWAERTEDEAVLRERGFAFSLQGPPLCHVRPQAFGRLLDNLVGNSFRYARKVEVSAAHDGNDLTVTIDDDGPGVPADRREDVFKPFVRLDEARNQDAGGTGLGLSIARDVARSHGGDITLAESPLGGLRAVVRVPA
ncbi:MAG TPA: ATP-binding protein [Mesorhizobium sp.]|nr:ATP-binding protein [Mesorhizobium sp.]